MRVNNYVYGVALRVVMYYSPTADCFDAAYRFDWGGGFFGFRRLFIDSENNVDRMPVNIDECRQIKKCKYSYKSARAFVCVINFDNTYYLKRPPYSVVFAYG